MSQFMVLLENKERGVTSFSSLSRIKREYRGEKVGHAGTLDKFASGLMVVLVGNATKLNPIFSSFSKRYIATLQLGAETDTLDPEGAIIATANIPGYEDLKSAVYSFLGKQKQIPPVYSALHVDGKRAYKEARKGNDISMPERDIEVYDISLLSYQNGIARIACHVSKGTYIRSLARDIGKKCSSRAYLLELQRTQIGPWSLDDREKSTKDLLDMTGLLSTIKLNPKSRKRVENGSIDSQDILFDSDSERPYGYLYFDSELYGICQKGDRLKIIARIEYQLLTQ